MHDIWNPWHGCKKISEGCENCYMYFLDEQRNQDGSKIFRVKNQFDYPLQRNRDGSYKIKSGELIRVCMTSDFFLEEADEWRDRAWSMMRERCDVKFFLLTKRPQRVEKCLPKDWGDGWENIFFNVTCENQIRADERIPILHQLPFKHKGIMCAPLIGKIHIAKFLEVGQIEQVCAGGENYDGSRPCDYEWIKILRAECETYDVTFCFFETGTNFVKDGKHYHLPDKNVQSKMSHKSGASYVGKPINFALTDPLGFPIASENLHKPYFNDWQCNQCAGRLICNGCSNCGKCIKTKHPLVK